MIQWLGAHPAAAGIVTLVLMWTDWLLTVLQHRERAAHSANHYRSYPTDTVEGNPALQQSVASGRLLDLRHGAISLALSVAVALALPWIATSARPLFLGFVWGLFLTVDFFHLSNLLGYVAARRGIHGQVWLHQRTAYLTQMGRYLALTCLLAVLTLASGSVFVAGVTVAGAFSTLRQLVWLRRVPAIPESDIGPR